MILLKKIKLNNNDFKYNNKMEEKNRQIKKSNYYILLGCCIFQFVYLLDMIILCIMNKYLIVLFHITNWSFLLSLIYLFSALACDTSLYFFSSKKLEKYNYFIRNYFSKIAFTFCFMIILGFWGILFFGIIIQKDTFTKSGTKITPYRIFNNLNLHLFIGIMMLVELFLSEREEVKLNWFSGISNSSIYILYCIIVCIAKYKFNLYAYVFIEYLNVPMMLLIGAIIYGLLIGCFFIYKYISNKINKKYFKVIELGEDANLFKNENEPNVINSE